MLQETWAEISLRSLYGNMRRMRQWFPRGVKLMAVVKANGYGHGDLAAAEAAEQAGADYLAVASLEEALRLRECGFKLPLLVLAPIRPEHVDIALAHDVCLTVTGASWFKEMRKWKPAGSAGAVRVHVKLDSGLGRIGVRTKREWDELVPWLSAEDIEVDGFYTHFATAGREDPAYLEKQSRRFSAMIAWSKASGLAIRHYHCAGSAAALRFPGLAMDMVRIGAAMYGYFPRGLTTPVELEPAMSLYSRLIQVKMLRRGEPLGYDNAFRAEEDMWIGTVPIGYADGWSQRMQGSEVLVDGCRARIVGKICMDQLMIRLPGPVAEGTLVTLIGRQGGEEVTFAELAEHIGGVAQEIATAVSARVPRMITTGKEEEQSLCRPRERILRDAALETTVF